MKCPSASAAHAKRDTLHPRLSIRNPACFARKVRTRFVNGSDKTNIYIYVNRYAAVIQLWGKQKGKG